MRLRIATVMATAFDNEEFLTSEEILLRFKKIFGRDMTPEEKHKFFLVPEFPERAGLPKKTAGKKS